jgi:hypothetical protein
VKCIVIVEVTVVSVCCHNMQARYLKSKLNGNKTVLIIIVFVCVCVVSVGES